MSCDSLYNGGEDEVIPDLVLPYYLTVKDDYKGLYKANYYMAFFDKTDRKPTYTDIKAELSK
jgi:hypothetical protein